MFAGPLGRGGASVCVLSDILKSLQEVVWVGGRVTEVLTGVDWGGTAAMRFEMVNRTGTGDHHGYFTGANPRRRGGAG